MLFGAGLDKENKLIRNLPFKKVFRTLMGVWGHYQEFEGVFKMCKVIIVHIDVIRNSGAKYEKAQSKLKCHELNLYFPEISF